MNAILHHWKPIRRIAVMFAIFSAVAATSIGYLSLPFGWFNPIVTVIVCGVGFGFGYFAPICFRAISEMNHQLFKSMKPKSTWMQVILFWMSLISSFIIMVGMALPREVFPDKQSWLELFASFCGQLGMFTGCGNFLLKERNFAGRMGGTPSPHPEP